MSQSLGDTTGRAQDGASENPEAALAKVTPASIARPRPRPDGQAGNPEFLNVVIDNMDAAIPRYTSAELHTYLHPRCRITGDHDHAYINSRYRFSEEASDEVDGQAAGS